MAVHLKDDFKEGTPLRLIRASWLNKVAGLWNWFRGGRCINVDIPDTPCEDFGPRIDLDLNRLDAELEQRGFTKGTHTTRLAPNAVNTSNSVHDDDTAALVAGFAPNADAVPTRSGGAETDASKIARVGTSTYAARADHQHPVCLDIGSASAQSAVTGDNVPSGDALLTDTWEPGTNGLTEYACTRVGISGTYRYFYFREHRYSKHGNLVYRGPEAFVIRARYS